MVTLAEIVEVLAETSTDSVSYLNVHKSTFHSFSRNTLNMVMSPKITQDDMTGAPPEVHQAFSIARDISGTYLRLPGGVDVIELSIMRKFAATLTDAELVQKMRKALDELSAFQTFQLLVRRGKLQQDWERFRVKELESVAIEWCAAHGVKVSG